MLQHCNSTLPLTFIGCHAIRIYPPHSNLAAIAVSFCSNDSVAPGLCCLVGREVGGLAAADARVELGAVDERAGVVARAGRVRGRVVLA
jgi:hypothetical protein